MVYLLLSIIVLLVGISICLYNYYYKTNKQFQLLSKQTSNYESIIDEANDAMLVIDIVDGHIHHSNPSAAKLLGYTKDQLVTRTLFDLHPKEYLEKSSRVVADVWEKGGMIYKDIPFKKSDGQLVQVECSAKVTPFAERPAIVIYARDITERLLMEKEINDQKIIIEEKNKDINDSINYAQRIQHAILPPVEKIENVLKDYFILYKPKDIVSGDFYWHAAVRNSTQNFLVIAAVDCTGHGVPGAFMSIIGTTLLNQTVSNPAINTPAEALDYLNREIKKTLNQNDQAPVRDGMDISLCTIDFENLKLEFAGANNPIYIIRNKELIELKADKQAITASPDTHSKAFTNQSFKLLKNDTIYLFTDGYADQFGGPKGKKFMYKQLKEVLINMHEVNMKEQKRVLIKTFENWKGKLDQIDDVLIIGVRV